MEVEVEEWGTWEQLILVSAVLRHGIDEWEAVVAELRARTFASKWFTPEVKACKDKYEDLQQHYETCSDLLEGLRQQRIAELKRTLEKSNDSIGFLQTKLQTLKAGKEHSSSVDYQSSPFESPAQTSVGQSPGKETSKDELSAGSLTQEIVKIESPSIHAAVVHTQDFPLASSKQDSSPNIEDMVTGIVPMEWGIGAKRKRGKRKRKGSSHDVREYNSNEAVLDSADPNQLLLSRIKVEPTSEFDLASPPYIENKSSQSTDCLNSNELTRIFDMVANNEYASIFRRRLDSQKRATYRMMVRQHMDLDKIKSRIDKQAIMSAKELLRDLHLLATNAAIFYSRNTREHKYAVILQDIIKKLVMQHRNSSSPSKASVVVGVATSPGLAANVPAISPANPIPKKPKTANPDNHKSLKKLKNDESVLNSAQRAKKSIKPKDSHSTKNCSQASKVIPHARNSTDASRQQPESKLASVNAHITKDGSMNQTRVKLASVNARKTKDGPMNQRHVKSAVKDSKERKRARKL